MPHAPAAKKTTRKARQRSAQVNRAAAFEWLALATILVLTFVAYLPAIHGGMLWDDDCNLTAPKLQSAAGLYRIWFDPAATAGDMQYYPLVHTVFWLEQKAWGDWHTGYHIMNLIWHSLSVLLLYAILKKLKIPGALLAAGIFALHPVMVESVAWMTEQKNTLSGVFYLSALLMYVGFDEARQRSRYVIALVLFACALLSKTATVTFPMVVLVVLWWQRGRLRWVPDVRPLLPFFLLSIVSGLMTVWVERALVGAKGSDFDLTLLERCLLAGRDVWFYLGKLVWPANLSFIYVRWTIDPAQWWQWTYSIAAIVATLALWTLRRRWRGPLAGWLIFCGTLAPVLGFVNVYMFRYAYVADHLQYLASLGIIVPVSAGIAIAVSHANMPARRMGIVAVAAALGILATCSWRQSHIYADVVALYRATLELNPECWLAHNNLGIDFYQKGDNATAIDHYRAALRLYPNYFEAHKNLGLALMKQSANDEAAAEFAAAMRIESRDPDVATNLGATLLKTGREQEAVAAFQAAEKLKPDSWTTYNNLGKAFSQARSYEEAIKCFEKALKLNPEALLVYNDLADAYAHNHQQSKAVTTLEHALNLATARGDDALMGNFRVRLKLAQNPNDPDILKNYGFQLARAGRLDEAIEKLQAALALKPNDVAILNGLGVALMLSDQAPQAVQHLRQAVQLKPNDADLHTALGQALLNADDLPSAIKEFEAAAALNPKHLTALTKLGIALNKAGRYSEAIPHFQYVLELQPRYNEARANFGVALFNTRNEKQAQEQFRKAMEIDPNDAAAHYEFGKFLVATNDIDGAISQFRQAVRLQPASSEFHQSLGDALLQRGRKAEAIENYRAALRRKPTCVQAYANLARLLAKDERREEAISVAEEGIQLARATDQAAAERQIGDWLRSYRAEPTLKPGGRTK